MIYIKSNKDNKYVLLVENLIEYLKIEIVKDSSISEFSKKNNFNKSSLYYLLNGDVNGKLSFIWSVCDKLNLNLSDIIKIIEEQNNIRR